MKKKIFILIIALVMFNLFVSTICYADFEFARIESEGNYEPVTVPDTPADAAGGGGYDPPGTTIETETEASFSIDVPVAIQGIVYEDTPKLEKVDDGSMAGTQYITGNQICDDDEPRIEGIQVADTVTDSNGSYSISGPGTFDVSFTFGQGVDSNNYKLNKDTLKYNSQDYSILVNGEGCASFDKDYLRKIKEIEKSFTEVYIVIDHSTSMRLSTPTERARIEIVKEAAINFVNELFEEAEGNLAVGYIAFGYEAVIVKKPTDIKDDIIDGIRKFKVIAGVGSYSGTLAPNFSQLNHKVGSNIGGAVMKAKDSYLSEKSNKVMVLFSDGAATAHDGVDSLYASDTDDQIRNKLTQVANKTRDDLNSIIESEITLINILNKTEGTEEEFVKMAFKNGDAWIGSYYPVDYLNLDEVNEALLDDTKKIIESTESEFIHYKDNKEFMGSDDPERRKIVNEYYNEMYYDKLKLFQAIDKLNGSKNNDIKVISELINSNNEYSKDGQEILYRAFIEEGKNNPESDLGKFLENSWMKSSSNMVTLYQVSRDGSGRPTSAMGYTFEYYTDEDGIEMCRVGGEEYKASNVSVNEITLTYNAALIRRDEFKLDLDEIITGARLTLSDGRVLYNMISSNASETVAKNKEFKEAYCKNLQKENGLIEDFDMSIKNLNIEEVANYPDSVFLITDLDLLQGATLEVEYTLIIKNNSQNATFNKNFGIVNYFDTCLLYNADSKLLTEDGKNSDYNWKVLDPNYMNSELKYISDNVIDKGSVKTDCLYVEFDKDAYEQEEGIPSDGNVANFDTKSKYVNPVIGNNGERYVKVVLSVVLSPEICNNFWFKNQSEILKYDNNNSRRANYLEKIATEVVVKNPISGNYIPTFSQNSLPDSITNINEVDTAIANTVAVVPPTGRPISRIYYIITVSVVVITGISCSILRKKFKRKS